MTIAKSKTTATAILILMMAFGAFAAVINIPVANAQVTLDWGPYPRWTSYVGVNSPTMTVWQPDPCIWDVDPDYRGDPTAFPNGWIAFIRPDGTIQENRSGPFHLQYPPPQTPTDVQIEELWTPDVQGTWNVTLYWPGDGATYGPTSVSGYKYVGPHYEKRNVWCFLSLRPYPVVGLGQSVLLNAWVSPPPATQDVVFQDYVFTVTPPTGASYTIGPMDSEAPGTVWFDLTFDQLGNWTIKFDFPGDYLSKAATISRTITVQEDPVTIGYPDTPLPTQEWTYPMNVQNREWRTIAGPWYDSNYNATTCASNQFTEGMRTAHILWKLPAYDSIGGYIGVNSIETGSGQEEYGGGEAGVYGPSAPNIATIMAGRGYYTAGGMIHCIDMRTGEELWAVEGTFDAGATRSRDPVLYDFGNDFRIYDAISGNLELDVPTPGMSADKFVDPLVFSSPGDRLVTWTVSGTTSNFANRILYNITNPLPNTSSSHSMIVDGLYIARHFQTGNTLSNTIQVDWLTAINMTTGALVYNNTVINPADTSTYVYRQGPAISAGNGLVFFAAIREINHGGGYIAFNVADGSYAWDSAPTDLPWGNFWAYTPQCSSPGRIYGLAYNGVYAFNAENGSILWHYIDTDTYNEEPYASNVDKDTGEIYASYSFGSTGPTYGGRPGNEVLYCVNSEHSPTFYYRNQGLSALDAETGELLWRIKCYGSPGAAVYDGIIVHDSTNGFEYFFCKGSTETAVSTQHDVYMEGDSVLLKGSVLDMSPAQKGTAAISDTSMSAWMEYLHMQQPFPMDATGVDVSIDALDPNGNFVHIGDATTDTTGMWKLLWETPPIPGTYTIVASFMGSESYYSSSAETAIGLTQAPAATPAPTPAPAPMTDTYVLGIGAAAIVAIVVIGAIMILLLRKR